MASLLYYIYNKEDTRGTLLRRYIESGEPVPMHRLQRLYRKCKYPYGVMVKLLLEEAGLQPRTVLDLTYGEGKFWSCYRPSYLAGFDVRRLDWVVEPDVFVKGPSWSAWYHVREGRVPRVDLIAVDPPWQRSALGRSARLSVGGRWWYRTSKGVGTPKQILESAARLSSALRVPLLVHYEREWVPPGFTEIVGVFWRPSLPHAGPEYRTWWGVLEPSEGGGSCGV